VSADLPICDRHDGPWGQDETCARCTWDDGTPRPVDQPGPLRPAPGEWPGVNADRPTGYIDPAAPDPRFPDRPTHADYADLSDVAQRLDLAADAGDLTSPLEALGLDEQSLMYFLSNRLAIFAQRTGGAFTPDAMASALYLDALTLGKVLGEKRAAADLARVIQERDHALAAYEELVNRD
jgi:hypothetical protein